MTSLRSRLAQSSSPRVALGVLSVAGALAVASAAAAGDGGRAILAAVARREGLLPSDLPEAEAPAVLVNIPRLPERLAAAGRRYLERRRVK